MEVLLSEHGGYTLIIMVILWFRVVIRGSYLLYAHTSKNGSQKKGDIELALRKKVTLSEEAADANLGHPLHPLLYP